jgi:hypothetical protein
LFDDKYVNYIKRTGLNLYYNIKNIWCTTEYWDKCLKFAISFFC